MASEDKSASIDLDSFDTQALKARLGELRRYL